MEHLAPTGVEIQLPPPPPPPPLSAESLWALWCVDALAVALVVLGLVSGLLLATQVAALLLWVLAPPLRRLLWLLGWPEPDWLAETDALAVSMVLICERLVWGWVVPLEQAGLWAWERVRWVDGLAWGWLHRKGFNDRHRQADAPD